MLSQPTHAEALQRCREEAARLGERCVVVQDTAAGTVWIMTARRFGREVRRSPGLYVEALSQGEIDMRKASIRERNLQQAVANGWNGTNFQGPTK